MGPLENEPLMICFIGGFFFSAKFGPGFEFFEGKQGWKEVKEWNCWNLIKSDFVKEVLL